MANPDEEINQLCIDQFEADHNMTDVMAALQLIANGDHPRRQELLESFRARWAEDPLVLDKWFTVQALSSRQDTLEVVRGLLDHPAFSIRNPNRVRSLVGAFSTGNPARFHQIDGAGYAFLVDRVLELDPLNPQVAARLLRGLTRWRRYDGERQARMREQLARILASKRISRDLFEVASKSVGGS
jgi:aminopeptidase N